MDTRKLTADITETAYWDRNSIDPRRENLTELRADDGTTLAYSASEEATAELIKRWNEYPDLVAALEDVVNIKPATSGADAIALCDELELTQAKLRTLIATNRTPEPTPDPADENQARYTKDEWAQEVREGNTRRGYFDWLKARIEQAGH